MPSLYYGQQSSGFIIFRPYSVETSPKVLMIRRFRWSYELVPDTRSEQLTREPFGRSKPDNPHLLRSANWVPATGSVQQTGPLLAATAVSIDRTTAKSTAAGLRYRMHPLPTLRCVSWPGLGARSQPKRTLPGAQTCPLRQECE